MDESTIDLQTFAAEFLSLARKKMTGTYKVVRADGQERYLLLAEGSIIDLDTREEYSILSAAVIGLGRLSDRDLRKALKAQGKTGATLGAVLLSQTRISEDDLLTVVRARLAGEISALFADGVRETSFIEHGSEEKLEGFAGELSEVLEVYADPEELFLEAARSLDRWDLVEKNFSLLRDVFYATPGAFKYFREESRYPHEVVVIGLCDGRRDVAEVIDVAVEQVGEEMNHFRAFAIARNLISLGELELINPVQMFQLGMECYDEGQLEKALKLFHRAAERGLDDFDLGFKIAQTLEALKHREEAAEQYLEFGDKCLAQFRPDDAIRSYRKVSELAPENLAIQMKLLKILTQENRFDEALSLGLLLAGRCAMGGKPREGLELALDLRRRGFKDERLTEKIIELAEVTRDESILRAERERLASDFCARKDVEKALEVYQQMFCDGNGSPDVRLKLIDLHLEKGDRKLALEHIKALLALGESEWVKEEGVLLRLHRLVCELKPGDPRSHRWLVDHYLRSGDSRAAAEVLKNLAAHLERKGEHREAILVLKQVLQIDVNTLESRWRLATAYAKVGKVAEQIEELRKVAQLSIHRTDTVQAERALAEIIKISPFDVEARKALGDLFAQLGDNARAATRFKEVALLSIIGGNLPEAQDYCRRLLVMEPRDPEIVHKLGDLCRSAGDDQKAIEQLVKAARIHIENLNLGTAREAVENALQLRPTNAESLELKRSLEELTDRLAEKPAAPKAREPREAVETPEVRRPPEPPSEPITAAGRGPDELFQPAPAIINKKSLAGITARLRTLKGGEPPPGRSSAEAPPAAPPAVEEAAGAKDGEALRTPHRKSADREPAAEAVDAAGPTDVDAAPAAAASAGPEREVAPAEPPAAKTAKVMNAASRLKAIAAAAKGGGPQAAPPAPADGRSSGNAEAAPEAPRSPAAEPAPAHPEAQELERLQAILRGQPASGQVAREGSSPSGTVGRPLVKSAALLAKLRKNAPEGAAGAAVKEEAPK
jgi:tetratricopeptide (TPR) repeat protein